MHRVCLQGRWIYFEDSASSCFSLSLISFRFLILFFAYVFWTSPLFDTLRTTIGLSYILSYILLSRDVLAKPRKEFGRGGEIWTLLEKIYWLNAFGNEIKIYCLKAFYFIKIKIKIEGGHLPPGIAWLHPCRDGSMVWRFEGCCFGMVSFWSLQSSTN